MKFIYKIHSGKDGFFPGRIPERIEDKRFLRLRWTHYLDEVSTGDEVWVYFRGPHKFEDGVYVRGRIAGVDSSRDQVRLRVHRFNTTKPFTGNRDSRRVADIVAQRYRQVFLLPDDWDSADECTIFQTAESCRARACEECPTWQNLPTIGNADVAPPSRLPRTISGFAPAYWAIPPRCYLGSADIPAGIHQSSQVVKAFKMGNAALAYPLALGMFDALRKRNLDGDFSCVIPIPLSPEKADRGEIHRALLLAKELGTLIGAPVRQYLHLLWPISKRSLQSAGVPYREFEELYDEALRIDKRAPSTGRVLLVDDVSTHGGTLRVASLHVWAAAEDDDDLQIVVATAGQMIVKAVIADEAAVKVPGS